MIEIKLGNSNEPEAEFAFDQRVINVGRSADNDVILHEAHVSGRHAEIRYEGGSYRYRDLGATNGSFVKRRGILLPIDKSCDFEIPLETGDVVYLGDPTFSTCLRMRVDTDSLTKSQLEQSLLDTGVVEVLEQVDMADEDEVRQLSLTFDREALVTLHAHATRAARLSELPEVLNSFADAALELYAKANHVSIYLSDRDSGELEPALSRARSGMTRPRRLSRTLRDLMTQRRQALTFSIYDPAFDTAASLKDSTVRAGMCAPLWSGDTLSGLVQVDWRGEMRVPFDQRDLEVLAVLANELSMSVERIRLQGELEETVSELRRAQVRMEALAFRDSLTGLSNRRLLGDRIEQSLRHAMRDERRFALLYLDLDGFKRVNDTFGHEAGDVLLQTVATRLRSCLRAEDTVARIGGDEFAALLFDVSDPAAAGLVARKMLELVRQPVQVPGHQLTVTGSMGITVAPADGEAPSTLLRNADLAMYRAKSRGRDNYQFFTEEMNREASRHLFLETELRQALTADQFIEHFQPVVSLADSDIIGFEALIRWNHPRRGLTMPDEFIQVAEETGLIVPLGNWVLKEACRAAGRLNDSGKPYRIAVNLSPRQFIEPDLPEFVESVLHDSKLAPERLVIEITESILMEDSQEALSRLTRLKDLGVALCVDDFGTGYSSLSYLKRFPVDLLKIDRSFTHGIPDDASDVEIASAVIAMAHKLNIQVVAEGVETREQLNFLRTNGCDFGQGFLFGRPSDLGELPLLTR